MARPNAIAGQAGPAMAIGAHGASPAGGVQYVRNLGAHVALELAFRTAFLTLGGEAGVRAYLLKGTVSPYAALRLDVAADFPFMEPEAHTRAVVHLAPALGFEAAERRGITASVEFYPWLGSLGWGRLWFLMFAFGYRF